MSNSFFLPRDEPVSGPVGPVGPTGATGVSDVLRYSTIFNLLSSSAPTGSTTFITDGYWSAGDGGGADYYWDASSTSTVDSGSVFAINGVAIGRIKQRIKDVINVRTYGAKGDGTTDDYPPVQAAINTAVPVASGSSTAALYKVYAPRGHYSLSQALMFGSSSALRVEGPKFYGDGQKVTRFKWSGADDYATVVTFYNCSFAEIEKMSIEQNSLFRCGVHFRVDDGKAIYFQKASNLYIEGGRWKQSGSYWLPGGGIAAGGDLDRAFCGDGATGEFNLGQYDHVYYSGPAADFVFNGVNGEQQTVSNCGAIHTHLTSAAYPRCMFYGFNTRGLHLRGYECANLYGENQLNMVGMWIEGPNIAGDGFKMQDCRMESTWQLAKIRYCATGSDGEYRNTPVTLFEASNCVSQKSVHTASTNAGDDPCYMVDFGVPVNATLTNILWPQPNTTCKVSTQPDQYKTSILLNNCQISNDSAPTNPSALLTLVGIASPATIPTAKLMTRGCSSLSTTIGSSPFWSTKVIPDTIIVRNGTNKTGLPTSMPFTTNESGVVIGLSGSEISRHMSVTSSWSTPNVNSGSIGTFDILVPNSTKNDVFHVGISASLSMSFVSVNYLTSSVVRVLVQNFDTNPAAVSGSTVRVDCWQHT